MFDLDAAAEEAGIVAKTMRFAGKEWSLPATVPIRCATLMASGDLEEALEELFGDNCDEIIGAGFGVEHLELLLTSVYKTDPGESSASGSSLNRAGRRARPTSNGSTR